DPKLSSLSFAHRRKRKPNDISLPLCCRRWYFARIHTSAVWGGVELVGVEVLR
ncbi:hypothetical protein BHM03_00055570, partial [Ensete ventricosum]